MPVTSSNDLKLPEHVLVKRIVDIELDPIQASHALRKLFGEFPEYLYGIVMFHFGNHIVGEATLGGIKREADAMMAVAQTLGKKSQIEQCKIAKMAVALPAEFDRHFPVGLSENLAHIAQTLTGFVLYPVQIFPVNKIDEKIGYVIDGIFVAEPEFCHSAFGQLVKYRPYWVVFRNGTPKMTYH